jgi:hypothetical protein
MHPLLMALASLVVREVPTNQVAMHTALAAPFPANEVEWRVQRKNGAKGLAVAYVTNRAIQNRLDEVFGPNGWQNTFRPSPSGGVLCGISIRVVQPNGQAEWITKWDGAPLTKVEPEKGGLSDSMKRAGVQLGIGRYLYRLPSQWVDLDDRGNIRRVPEIPPAFLPQTGRSLTRDAVAPDRVKKEQAFQLTGIEWCKLLPGLSDAEAEWNAQRPRVIEIYGSSINVAFEANSTRELHTHELLELTEMIKAKIRTGRGPAVQLTGLTAEELEAEADLDPSEQPGHEA